MCCEFRTVPSSNKGRHVPSIEPSSSADYCTTRGKGLQSATFRCLPSILHHNQCTSAHQPLHDAWCLSSPPYLNISKSAGVIVPPEGYPAMKRSVAPRLRNTTPFTIGPAGVYPAGLLLSSRPLSPGVDGIDDDAWAMNQRRRARVVATSTAKVSDPTLSLCSQWLTTRRLHDSFDTPITLEYSRIEERLEYWT